jgi:hypothetical protein
VAMYGCCCCCCLFSCNTYDKPKDCCVITADTGVIVGV